MLVQPCVNDGGRLRARLAADERAEHTDDHRVEAAAAIVLDDPPGEPTGEEAHENPTDDAHGTQRYPPKGEPSG